MVSTGAHDRFVSNLSTVSKFSKKLEVSGDGPSPPRRFHASQRLPGPGPITPFRAHRGRDSTRDSKPLGPRGESSLITSNCTKSKSVIWQYVPPKVRVRGRVRVMVRFRVRELVLGSGSG